MDLSTDPGYGSGDRKEGFFNLDFRLGQEEQAQGAATSAQQKVDSGGDGVPSLPPDWSKVELQLRLLDQCMPVIPCKLVMALDHRRVSLVES